MQLIDLLGSSLIDSQPILQAKANKSSRAAMKDAIVINAMRRRLYLSGLISNSEISGKRAIIHECSFEQNKLKRNQFTK